MKLKKVAVLTTNDTVYGFRLAGVLAEKIEVNNHIQAEKKVRELLSKEEIGILALAPTVVSQLKPDLVKQLTTSDSPVVINLPEISAQEVSLTEKEELENLIKHALGIKINF